MIIPKYSFLRYSFLPPVPAERVGSLMRLTRSCMCCYLTTHACATQHHLPVPSQFLRAARSANARPRVWVVAPDHLRAVLQCVMPLGVKITSSPAAKEEESGTAREPASWPAVSVSVSADLGSAPARPPPHGLHGDTARHAWCRGARVCGWRWWRGLECKHEWERQ
jgi:hypothetical protein